MPIRRLISVVVPAQNEEANIGPLYERLKAVTSGLATFRWEFIFVDDGSSDGTLERVRRLREQDARVCALRLSRNFGSYAAIRAGFDYARGDAVVSISADLQDPPEIIEAFTERWQEGHDIVWGVRDQRDDPWGKKFLASLFYRLVRLLGLHGLPAHGMDCGLFDRPVIDAFRRIRDKNSITFITLYRMGFRQARVPYHRLARQRGASKWPLGKRLDSALDVITSFSYLPLRLSSYLGLVVSSLAMIGALVVLYDRLVLGIGEWGWPSLMVTMLFLGGVQMLMLGAIGEYLWRISNEVRGWPQYIVMEEFGLEGRSSNDRVGSEASSSPDS